MDGKLSADPVFVLFQDLRSEDIDRAILEEGRRAILTPAAVLVVIVYASISRSILLPDSLVFELRGGEK